MFATIQELFAGPEGEKRWNKGSMARDRNGNRCHPCSDVSVRWCLVGACRLVYLGDADDVNGPVEIAVRAIERAIRSVDGANHVTAVFFNDASSTTIDDIRKLVEKARV